MKCNHICEVCEYITDCIEESIEEQEQNYYKMRILRNTN